MRCAGIRSPNVPVPKLGDGIAWEYFLEKVYIDERSFKIHTLKSTYPVKEGSELEVYSRVKATFACYVLTTDDTGALATRDAVPDRPR
jgi:hypothetical protein